LCSREIDQAAEDCSQDWNSGYLHFSYLTMWDHRRKPIMGISVCNSTYLKKCGDGLVQTLVEWMRYFECSQQWDEDLWAKDFFSSTIICKILLYSGNQSKDWCGFFLLC
jgi:hypothetical protein